MASRSETTRTRREIVWFPARGEHSSETKPFYLTSEFLVFALYLIALGIGASVSAGVDDRMFWILSTAVVFGYMISRGIAKSGTRSRAHDPREDIDIGGD